MSHHSTAAGTKGTICQSSWKEGRHHIFIFFQRKMKLRSKPLRKTLVIPISLFTPGLEKMLSGSVWIKKGFYLGGGEQGLYFQNQKVVSHGLINKTNYLKLSLSQKI